jgi:hypothetical protein
MDRIVFTDFVVKGLVLIPDFSHKLQWSWILVYFVKVDVY